MHTKCKISFWLGYQMFDLHDAAMLFVAEEEIDVKASCTWLSLQNRACKSLAGHKPQGKPSANANPHRTNPGATPQAHTGCCPGECPPNRSLPSLTVSLRVRSVVSAQKYPTSDPRSSPHGSGGVLLTHRRALSRAAGNRSLVQLNAQVYRSNSYGSRDSLHVVVSESL